MLHNPRYAGAFTYGPAPRAAAAHTGQLTDAQKNRISQLVTDLPGIWNDPATPARERKRIARLLLTDITVTMVQRVIRTYQLRSREQRLRADGMLTLTQVAALLGVSTGTVKIWHHAGLLTGHPYNDKGQCLYPPPGPNPPARTQGRKLSTRRPASPAAPADDA